MPARVPPPTRIRPGGGFGGFAANPSIPYSGGRVLVSDVQQAADALNFGGPTTERTVPAPNSTATATPAVSPPPVVIDPSGTGFVNSSLFQGGEFGSHNTVWFNNPTAGGDVEANAKVGTDNTPMIATRTPGSPPPLVSDPNADWTGSDAAPNTARNDGLPSGPGGMEDEPNLLGGDASGPTVDVSGRGGGLPSPYWNQPAAPRYTTSGSDMRNFGGTLALGQFLNTPLAALRFGTDRSQTGGSVSGGLVQTSVGADYTPGDKSIEAGAGVMDASPLPADIAALPEATLAPGAVTEGQPASVGALAVGGRTTPIFGNVNSPTGTPVYSFGKEWRPVEGAPTGVRWDPNAPTGNFTADQFTKSWESGGQDAGAPNMAQSDIPDTFYNGVWQFDSEGFPHRIGDRTGQRDSRWVMPSQAESARLGLSFSNNADKYNAWLRAHNPWYYGPNGVLAQNAQQLLTGRGG